MRIYRIYFLNLMLFFFMGCKEKEVTITKDYVVNPYWDKTDNSFIVAKMKLKDSNNNSLNLNNITSQKLLSELVKDTSFSFTANVKYDGKRYDERKVYFSRDNDFLWRKPPNIDPSRNMVFNTIGELDKRTWYFLGGLDKEKTLYYLYIDSLDKLHTFKVSSTSWTNY
jgi:hypothetical protein